MPDGYQMPPPGYPPQAPQYPQQYAPEPAAPAPKRRAPVVLIVLALVGALAVCGCIGAVVMFGAFSGDDIEEWTISEDQAKILGEFGPPQTFTVMWVSDVATETPEGEEPPLMRLENWDYPLLGVSFSFRDGVFTKRNKTKVPEEDIVSAALRPDMFNAGMSPDDVQGLIGVEPDRVAKVLPKEFEGLEVRSWRGQVIAGFQEGKLALISTLPVVQKEGSGS